MNIKASSFLKIQHFLFALIMFSSHVSISQIRIACIGNNIKAGAEIKSYPIQMQKTLGNSYRVKTFGKTNTTLLFNSTSSWIKSPKAFDSLVKFQPDFVIIELGANDSKSIHWDKNKTYFKKNYFKLIDTLHKRISPNVKIYLCTPLPVSYDNKNQINSNVIKNEIIPLIKAIAKEKSVGFVDLFTPVLPHFDTQNFPDGVNPNTYIHSIIAESINHHIIPTKKVLEEKKFEDTKIELVINTADKFVKIKLPKEIPHIYMEVHNEHGDNLISTPVDITSYIYLSEFEETHFIFKFLSDKWASTKKVDLK